MLGVSFRKVTLVLVITGWRATQARRILEGEVMFDILSDQMKRDAHLQISNSERLVYWLVVVIVSVSAFGGLYFGIQVLQ